MTQPLSPIQCSRCTRLRRDMSGPPDLTLRCDAFPKGIPSEILLNRYDHRQPYEGDQGIRFAPLRPEFRRLIERVFGPGGQSA